jgi:hypothetical protein
MMRQPSLVFWDATLCGLVDIYINIPDKSAVPSSSILKMEAASCTKAMANIYNLKHHYIPEDTNFKRLCSFL